MVAASMQRSMGQKQDILEHEALLGTYELLLGTAPDHDRKASALP